MNDRRLLNCFSLVSSVSINYTKSTLYTVGCDEDWGNHMATSLKYNSQKLPFIYLGVPLGANPSCVSTWKPVVEKIEKRLALWKAKVLSRSGRLTLIKAVFNNLLMYYLSLFKIPKAVANRIVQIQRNFFWIGDEKKRGIPLVAWETIQKPKELGGLGVGDLIIKNVALLFKWWWKFSDKRNPLWKKVVRYNHYKEDDIIEISNIKRKKRGIWGR